MDKVTKQRDPKPQAAGCKGHEKYMANLKEDILKNVGSSNGGSSSSNSTKVVSILPTIVPVVVVMLLALLLVVP